MFIYNKFTVFIVGKMFSDAFNFFVVSKGIPNLQFQNS